MKEAARNKRRDRLLRRAFTAADGLLALGVVALAVVLDHPALGHQQSGRASEVVVEVNGEETMRLTLSEEAHDYEVEGYEGTSYFQIEGYEVRMVDSACRDKICVHQGFVSDSGNAVVCLPNRVVLRLEGQGGLDTVQR